MSRIYLIICLTMSLLLPGTLAAQDLAVTGVDSASWPRLNLVVALPDEEVKAEDFTLKILPDGQPAVAARVSKLARRPEHFHIVVALDTSLSLTKDQLTATQEALSNYVDQLSPNEDIALLAFNDSVQIISGFTTDRAAFKKSLTSVERGGKITELYGAMLAGLDMLKNLTGRRMLLVISDGHDEGDTNKVDVLNLAHEQKIQLCSVGLPTINKNGKKDEINTPKYMADLKSFADETGGMHQAINTATELKLAAYDLLLKQRQLVGMEEKQLYRLEFAVADAAPTAPVRGELSWQQGDFRQSFSFDIQPPAAIVPPAAPAAEQNDTPAVTPSPAAEDEGSPDNPAAAPIWKNPILWAVVAVLIIILLVFALRRPQKAVSVHSKKYINKETMPPVRAVEEEKRKTILMPVKDEAAKAAHFILEFPDLGLNFPLSAGTLLMGAAPGNNLRVEESTVSSRHAEFQVNGGNCQVQDLGSTNGTQVNGVRINRITPLKPGDSLYFGKARAILKLVRPVNR